MSHRAALILSAAAMALAAPATLSAREPQGRDSKAGEHAQKLVDESVAVIDKMKADPGAAALLRRARGVFIVPEFGKGGLNIGLQAGGAGGRMVYLLMSPKAVATFNSDNKVSLNAKAGLTVVKFSDGVGATNRGDVVLWSDTVGAYAGATVGVSDINFNNDENRAYYGPGATFRDVLAGRAHVPGTGMLKRALS